MTTLDQLKTRDLPNIGNSITQLRLAFQGLYYELDPMIEKGSQEEVLAIFGVLLDKLGMIESDVWRVVEEEVSV